MRLRRIFHSGQGDERLVEMPQALLVTFVLYPYKRKFASVRLVCLGHAVGR